MTDSNQPASTALVTGASRGFGRAIATALHAEGARVVAVARSSTPLEALHEDLGDRLIPVVADVADPVVAGTLIDRYQPDTLVLNAGGAPLPRRLQEQTWETFSRNWEVDVRHAFHWIREALLLPLRSGSTVVAMSSGAAVMGCRSAVATPAPRPRSGSSPATRRTSRREKAWASASSRSCRS